MRRNVIVSIAELILDYKLSSKVLTEYKDDTYTYSISHYGIIPLFDGHEIMVYFTCECVDYTVHLTFNNDPYIETSQVLK